jgi:tape measure domain-containing protein
MSEFIEVLSPNALAELKALNTELVKTVASVKLVNENMINTKTPSGSDSAMKALTQSYKEQEQAIKKLQNEISNLNKAKAETNQKTQQEKTDLQILNVEKRREATLNSTVAGEYRKLSTAVAIASEKYQNLIVRGRLAGQSQREFNRELRNAQKEFRTLQTQVLSADKAVDKWNRTGERSIGLGRDLLGAFGVVGGVTAFALITRDIFQQTKEIQSLNNALKLVTETQENYYSQQAFLADISERFGLEINDLTKQFTQFYVSAKDKLAGSEIQDIFESISKAGASMGLSVESQQRAFLALNQMMSKGTIQAEELRGQLGEALPGAFGIMAKAVGVTEKELAKMMKAGDLLASEVLPKFAKQLEITYGIENLQRIESLTSAQNRFANSWRDFIANLDKDGNKLSAFFKTIVDSATAVIKGFDYLFQSSFTRRENELKMLTDSAYKTQKKSLADMDELAKQNAITERDRIRLVTSFYAEETQALIDRNKVLESYLKNEETSLSNAFKYKEEIKKNNAEINKGNNLNAYRIGQLKALDEALTETIAEEKKLTKETEAQRKERERAEEDRLQQIYTNRKKELELELFVINQSLQNEDLFYTDRLMALELYQRKQFQITSLDYAEQIRKAKGNYSLQKEALLDYHKEVLEIISSASKEREKLESLALRPIDAVKVGADPTTQLSESAKKATEEFIKLKKAEDDAKLSMAELKKITDEYLKTFTEGFFADAGLPTLFKVLNDEILGFGDNFAVTFTTIAEIAQEAFAFITEASNANFKNEYANLERQRDIALLFAGDSASAREEIERQAEEKRRQIQKREFQAKKQQALFNIAIDTAQAIVAALPNIPLSITIGVIGALQAGVVASQQMPAFWKGTDNAPEGFALTQERGREIITDKHGNIKSTGSDKGAQVTWLNKGDKVLNNEKTMDFLMFNNDLNNILTGNGISNPKVEVNAGMTDSQVNAIVSAIKTKETSNVTIDKRGIKEYVTKGRQITERMNSRVEFKGRDV